MQKLKLFYTNSRLKLVFIAAVSVTILVIGGFVLTRNTNPIPENIRQKLTFSPFLVHSDSTEYKATNYESILTEDKTGATAFVYSIRITESANNVTVTQYAQPPQFSEIPEYKERFLSSVIVQYDTVQTTNGIIYLGKSSRQNNEQIGIMLEKGLIVFMKPVKELDRADWHKLGEQFYIQKTD